MTPSPSSPRVLVVTPEVTCVQYQTGSGVKCISARAGGLGDICATQIHALCKTGLDVHLALPNYRNVFKCNAKRMPDIDTAGAKRVIPEHRIHLAQDRSFYYHPKMFTRTDRDNLRISMAFQREVIHRIIPEVQPDLIHCYDWMTGLIPAMARRYDIPCVFSLYRLNSATLLLSAIEERGIDVASFWQHCYYQRMPVNYHETRDNNPLDLLLSGVFSADMTTTMSRTYQRTLMDEENSVGSPQLKSVLINKWKFGGLRTIESIPDPSFDPNTDPALMRTYGPANHHPGKLFNKLQLQESFNLPMDTTVPLCLWPTRLDSHRFGCELMMQTLPDILARYRPQRLQIVFVADGDMQKKLRSLIIKLGAMDRVAVCDFDAGRYRLAFGGADFVLMPLRRDPCALPCKIGLRYGTLPIAYDACAIHDCVAHLNTEANTGNGFTFKFFDAEGLRWAMDQALAFYSRPISFRSSQVRRIMTDSLRALDIGSMAQPFRHLYQRVIDKHSMSHRASSDRMESQPIAA